MRLTTTMIPRIALCLVLGFPLFPPLTYGQATQSQADELDNALARAKSGEANGRDVVVIAKAGAIQAIPALEQQFIRATDLNIKTNIASGLVKLRDRDNTYWNFLLEQTTLAVDSDVPDPVYSESQRRMLAQPPELQTWADTHGVSIQTAGQYARFDYPGRVIQLAAAEDPRGIPLLRKALKSRNYLIVNFAAAGAALVHDNESIPLIIAAVRTAPVGYNSLIAGSLVYFDDPRAQAAVDTFMPKDKAQMARDDRKRGRDAIGW
jgi:Tfp pilus assembly protein FimT